MVVLSYQQVKRQSAHNKQLIVLEIRMIRGGDNDRFAFEHGSGITVQRGGNSYVFEFVTGRDSGLAAPK